MNNLTNLIINNFLENNILRNDEHIIQKGYIHYIVYWIPVLEFLIFLLALLLDASIFIISSMFFIFILETILTYLTNYTTEIIITDKKVIIKEGIIRRDITEIDLNKIESVIINQSILGRILNYGILDIKGIGFGSIFIYNLENPISFRNAIYNQV